MKLTGVLLTLLRIAGTVQIILGIGFWTGHWYTAVPVHEMNGVLFVSLLWALAVNEENAAGGCVVAAPTPGAPGPVAALLEHWRASDAMPSDERAIDFLLAGAAALGGSAPQIKYAAERALEAHWGLACDSAAGLVQNPCIARNAAGAAHALDAAQAAIRQPSPRVNLDGLVRSMIETARGMAGRYKTDSLAGLASNVADC